MCAIEPAFYGKHSSGHVSETGIVYSQEMELADTQHCADSIFLSWKEKALGSYLSTNAELVTNKLK